MRSTTRSRYYMQCSLDDQVEHWSDDRFWDELRRRLDQEAADSLRHRPLDREEHRAAAQLRRRADALRPLFLAGDAAHIVPPTGAKGLNLAASDVALSVAARCANTTTRNRDAGIDAYSAKGAGAGLEGGALFLVDDHDAAQIPRHRRHSAQRIQLAELDYVTQSQAAMTSLAENYVGLPF